MDFLLSVVAISAMINIIEHIVVYTLKMRRKRSIPTDTFRVDTSANLDNLHAQVAGLQADIDSLHTRVKCLVKTDSALKANHTEAVRHVSLLLSAIEEAVEDLEEVKSRVFTVEGAVTEVVGEIDDINEVVQGMSDSSEVIAKGFKATVANITKLQKAQMATRDLLDTTINSIDWGDEEEDVPTVQDPSANPLINAFVPEVEDSDLEEPEAEDVVEPNILQNTASEDNEELLVPPRGPNDPMITDLRARPFEEAPSVGAGSNLYAIPPNIGVEEWRSGGGSNPFIGGRTSSRTRRSF